MPHHAAVGGVSGDAFVHKAELGIIDHFFGLTGQNQTFSALGLCICDGPPEQLACIAVAAVGGNDCIIHLASSELGFGGVGESGMGSYHGKIGFETFSHKKSIVDKALWFDLPLRYQPYDEKAKDLLEKFLK